jgi:F420-non-reducing hydrogenase iron-sulfur subunit
VALCKGIMEHTGIDPERLDIEFMSSGDGILLAEKINCFTEEIKKLGPAEHSPEIRSGLEKIIRLVPYIKIKCREKLSEPVKGKRDSYTLFTKQEIARILKEAPTYYINPEKCKACMICRSRCPVEAIDGASRQVHVINQDKCIKCGTCIEVCPPKFSAIDIISGTPLPHRISENI